MSQKSNITQLFMSYEQAVDHVHKLEIKNSSQWYKFCQGEMGHFKKPDNLPTHPQKVYKSQWRGWAMFLGASYQKGGTQSQEMTGKKMKLLDNLRKKHKQECQEKSLLIPLPRAS